MLLSKRFLIVVGCLTVISLPGNVRSDTIQSFKSSPKKKPRRSKKSKPTKSPVDPPTLPPTPEPTCENQADSIFAPKESCTCRGKIETVYFVGDKVCGPQYLVDAVQVRSTPGSERLSFMLLRTMNVDSIELLYDDTCTENTKVTTNFLGFSNPPANTIYGAELSSTKEYVTAPLVYIAGECITALDVEVDCQVEVKALNICVPPTDRKVVMVPDSITKRVILFDEFDGLLLDKCFIDGYEGDVGFNRPINAIEVNDDEIWISDQNRDAIFKFTKKGVFIGIVDEVVDAVTGLKKTNGLGNVRGIEFVGDQLYVANNDPLGVIVFQNGKNVGMFGMNKTQDVLAYQDELYLSINDNNADSISVYSVDGANSVFQRNIAESDGVTAFDFLQQLTVRQSTGTLLAGGFSTPSGIYEFALDGTVLNYFHPAKARAVYELGNGKLLWSEKGMVIFDISLLDVLPCCVETEEYSFNTGLDFSPSMQYIEPIQFDAPSDDADSFVCDPEKCSEGAVASKCPRTCNICLLLSEQCARIN
mmetsp:Transcript_28639/g.32838  ORF Transcript_28639/g.32838 Transcript_28639/m.32838 type:complete len:532 (+) Transcript_28639:449-2044(+)